MEDLGIYTFVHSNGDEIDIDLNTLLRVGEDITSEFAAQAGNYAYVATLAAEAELQEMLASHDKDKTYSKLYIRKRRDFEALGSKFTEAVLNSHVEIDSDYEEVVDRLLNAKAQVQAMKAITRALEMKANMLISLGAHLRAEYNQTDMHIGGEEKLTQQVKAALETSRQYKRH